MINLYTIKFIFQNFWLSLISILKGDMLLQDFIKGLKGFYEAFMNGPFDLYIILLFLLLFTIIFKKILTKLRDS
jgi:hypothetical protein